MMPTVAEVDGILGTPKRLVRTMHWAPRPGREESGWRLFVSALEDINSGIVLPGALLRAQWRRGTLPFPEKFNFALVLAEQRVYAWDVDRLERHNNEVGRGLPFFGKRIDGSQEHIWTEDGYGYCEPLRLGDEEIEAVWPVFCKRVKIVENFTFVDPDPNRKQLRLI